MKNWITYVLVGLVALFFSLIGLKNDIDSYKTQLTGENIKVEITYVPNCIGTRTPHALKFKYLDNGQVKNSFIQIRSNCDDYFVGQEIEMKADLDKEIFLFKNGSMIIEFYASGIFFIFGIVMIILGLKKRTAHNTQYSQKGV